MNSTASADRHCNSKGIVASTLKQLAFSAGISDNKRIVYLFLILRKEIGAMCREIEAYAEKRAAEAVAEAVSEAAIRQVVRTGLKYGASKSELTADLMVDHHLTEDEAKATIKKYR